MQEIHTKVLRGDQASYQQLTLKRFGGGEKVFLPYLQVLHKFEIVSKFKNCFKLPSKNFALNP